MITLEQEYRLEQVRELLTELETLSEIYGDVMGPVVRHKLESTIMHTEYLIAKLLLR